MTILDAVAAVLIAGYVAAGWFTGTIRRVVGVIAVYFAFLVGTFAGHQGGSVIEQFRPTIPLTDARLYGYLFFFVVIVAILEGMALAIHPHLQFAVVALDRGVGALLGLVTAIVVIAGFGFILAGFAQPVGAQAPDSLAIGLRDGVSGSVLVRPIVNTTGGGLVKVLFGVLPRDPAAWFGAA